MRAWLIVKRCVGRKLLKYGVKPLLRFCKKMSYRVVKRIWLIVKGCSRTQAAEIPCEASAKSMQEDVLWCVKRRSTNFQHCPMGEWRR